MQQAKQPKDSVVDLSFPMIDYKAFRHFAQWGQIYGPSNRLSRLMTTVISKGSILDITPPSPNSSFSVGFYGPSVSCAASTSFDNHQMANLISNSGGDVLYISFVPLSVYFTNQTQLAAALAGLDNTMRASAPVETFDRISEDHARLYVAVPSLNSSSSPHTADTTIECGLYNSSFEIDYTFRNGVQDTNVRTVTRLNGVAWASVINDCEASRICAPTEAAYITMLDAFGSQLVGKITQSQYGLSATQTQITNSVFMETQELQKVQERVDQSLSSSAEAVDTPDVEPLSTANISMADALEQAFINFTLSLFSDSYFLYVHRLQLGIEISSSDLHRKELQMLIILRHSQNADASASIPVHIFSPQNAYSYQPRNLLIAYCVSVGATTVVVIASIISITRSKSNICDTSFSTVLRTTRNPELDALIVSSGSPGAAPLTKHLAKTKLRLLDSKPVTNDGENENNEDGSALRTYFMVVRVNEPSGDSDSLAEQSVAYRTRERRMADVDSLLTVDGVSNQ